MIRVFPRKRRAESFRLTVLLGTFRPFTLRPIGLSHFILPALCSLPGGYFDSLRLTP